MAQNVILDFKADFGDSVIYARCNPLFQLHAVTLLLSSQVTQLQPHPMTHGENVHSSASMAFTFAVNINLVNSITKMLQKEGASCT